jgi:hypothetical protein
MIREILYAGVDIVIEKESRETKRMFRKRKREIRRRLVREKSWLAQNKTLNNQLEC